MLQRFSNGLFGDPISLVDDMRRQLDWVFGPDPFTAAFRNRGFPGEPRFEAQKTDTGAVLTAELPGVRAEDLSVRVENKNLTITGRRTTEAPEGYETIRSERAELDFTRTFTLGEEFDPESIQAEMKDGILTITLGRRPEAQPKVIDIKAS